MVRPPIGTPTGNGINEIAYYNSQGQAVLRPRTQTVVPTVPVVPVAPTVPAVSGPQIGDPTGAGNIITGFDSAGNIIVGPAPATSPFLAPIVG